MIGFHETVALRRLGRPRPDIDLLRQRLRLDDGALFRQHRVLARRAGTGGPAPSGDGAAAARRDRPGTARAGGQVRLPGQDEPRTEESRSTRSSATARSSSRTAPRRTSRSARTWARSGVPVTGFLGSSTPCSNCRGSKPARRSFASRNSSWPISSRRWSSRSRPSIVAGGNELIVQPPPAGRICCDAQKLERVVEGLLSNAAKFTQNGRITVSASMQDSTCTLSIEDTGRRDRTGANGESLRDHGHFRRRDLEPSTTTKSGSGFRWPIATAG